ncbi:LuxR C-terminal-related transcriptional regulator [Streptomyces virginiae]|uniref:LuxR C-terminal-related transcriptional regulator n=1 Tax=Streptomyces virginiae TaxID=1961 RepID=UPI003676C6ED
MQDLGRWPMVGREGHLNSFRQVLADRRSHSFIVSGPAGVGRSRLAEECSIQAERDGHVTGRVMTSKAAGAVPLGAVAHLIPAGVDLSDPRANFAEVAAALALPSRSRRVMLVDDLHLLDSMSAMLLRQLADAGVIFLIGTVRRGEPAGGGAVEALQQGDVVRRVDLAELDERQAETLLQQVLGGPLGRRTLQDLFSASGGNVLFLRELVRGALDTQGLRFDGEVWELAAGCLSGTPHLVELIGARLTDAGPDSQPVLDLLSLCEPLALSDAESVASPQIMDELEQAGLIAVARDERRTTVALTHPMYGEVLRRRMTTLRKRCLLMQQAQRIEACGARRLDDPLRVASWRLAATGTADPDLLVQAARLARNAHDYSQVVSLLEAVPEQHRTAQNSLLLGEALFEVGQSARAETVLAEADTQAVGDPEKMVVAVARTMNSLWAASCAEAWRVSDAARAQVASAVGRHMVRINEGFLHVMSGAPVYGLESLAELEADPSEAPDGSAWLMGSMARGMAMAVSGNTLEAANCAEHAYAVHHQLNDQTALLHPVGQLVPLIFALAEAGQLARARETGETAWTELGKVNSAVRPWLAYHLAHVEWLAGHPATARRWYAEAAAHARAHHAVKAMRLIMAGLAASAAQLGDTAAAKAALASLETYPSMGYRSGEERLGEAWLYAVGGHIGRARETLAHAADIAHSTGHITSESLLLTDIARLGGAREVSDQLTRLAKQCTGTLAVGRARMAEALALDDPEYLLSVSTELEAAGVDLLAAEAATAASTAWRRAGCPRQATAATLTAATAAKRCEGARTPALVSRGPATPLTPREHEIALLAAAGTASKDIAATLTLSARTVDNHLQRVYQKLGITTRRELTDTFDASCP